MDRRNQLPMFIRCTICCFAVAMAAVISTSAQNAVPPTARQAAASPAFAPRLAHPRTAPAAPPASRRASPQDEVIYSNGMCSVASTRLYTGDTGGLKVLDSAGSLYGINYGDCYGKDNYGSIFKLSPGKDSWVKTEVYRFTGGADGAAPTDLVLDAEGNLWGTTSCGGAYGKGVIFEITP